MTAIDLLGVKPGDRVRISAPGKNVLLASVYLYGIPLVLLLGGIALGAAVFARNAELRGPPAALSVLCITWSSAFPPGQPVIDGASCPTSTGFFEPVPERSFAGTSHVLQVFRRRRPVWGGMLKPQSIHLRNSYKKQERIVL